MYLLSMGVFLFWAGVLGEGFCLTFFDVRLQSSAMYVLVLCVKVCQKVNLWFALIRSIALLMINWGHAIFKTLSKVLCPFQFIGLKARCAVNALLQFLRHHFQTLRKRLVKGDIESDSACMQLDTKNLSVKFIRFRHCHGVCCLFTVIINAIVYKCSDEELLMINDLF